MIKIKVQIYDMALAVLFSNFGSIKAKEYIKNVLKTTDSKGMYHVDDDAIHYMKH